MRYITFVLLLFLSTSYINAQTITKDTTFNGWKAIYTIPVGHDARNDSSKVIIFMPGLGEYGFNLDTLKKWGFHNSSSGLGTSWDGGVQLANGRHTDIVYVTIMPPTANTWPSPAAYDSRITAILNRFRAKVNAWYLTGFSRGGYSASYYASWLTCNNSGRKYKKVTGIFTTRGAGVGGADCYPANTKMGHYAAVGGKALILAQIRDERNNDKVAHNMNDSMPGSVIFYWTAFTPNANSNQAHAAQVNAVFNPNFNNFNYNSIILAANSGHQPSIPAINRSQNIYQMLLRMGDTSLPASPIPISNASKVGDSAYNMKVIIVQSNGGWNYGLMKSAKDTITKKTPLVIGFHGVNQTAFGVKQMVSDTGIWIHGLARNIAEGIMPNKFKNFRTGDSTEFNFIFPQRTIKAMYLPEAISGMLNGLASAYPWIDTNNVFLYGFDLGGNSSGVPMVDGNEALLNRIKGFVLLSASYPHHNVAKRTLKQPNGMKDKRKPVYIQWSTSDTMTGVVAWNNQLRDTLNKYRANQVTQYLHTAGHGGWTAASHPNRKQNVTFMWGGTHNVNTMEWMASYINYTPTAARQSTIDKPDITILEDKTEEISIYPNPVSSELTIHNKLGKKIEANSFRIFNSSGAIVMQGVNKSTITVHSLSPGMYIIQITKNNKTSTKQFIKK